MNPEEAKKALHASAERISSMQNQMKNSSERDEEFEEPEELEGPLGTSSPIFPQKLELAPGGETTETEIGKVWLLKEGVKEFCHFFNFFL